MTAIRRVVIQRSLATRIFVGGVLLLVVTFGLVWYKVPTRVRLSLTVSRSSFSLLPGKDRAVTQNVQIRSLSVRDFSSISLKPNRTARGNSVSHATHLAQLRGRSQRLPLDTSLSSLVLTPKDGLVEPVIQLRAAGSGKERNAGTLYAIMAPARSRVTLHVPDKNQLSISLSIYERPMQVYFSPKGEILIAADHCHRRGVPDRQLSSGQIRMKVKTANNAPFVSIRGKPKSLSLCLDVASDQRVSLFYTDLEIHDLAFESLSETGEPISALTGGGIIYYPDFGDNKQEKKLDASDYLYLDPSSRFRLHRLTWQPNAGGLNLVLEGYVNSLVGGPKDGLRNYQLSLFDVLKAAVSSNPFFLVMAFLIGTVCFLLGKYVEILKMHDEWRSLKEKDGAARRDSENHVKEDQ